jgi:hypothetical protein
MTRIIAFVLLIACVGVFVYDAQLVLSRAGANGIVPLSLWKIAAAIIIQLVALAFALWYLRFLAQRKQTPAQSASSTLLQAKLLPFVVPVVLSMASVTLLEVGLFCGDQAFPSIRGRPACPSH